MSSATTGALYGAGWPAFGFAAALLLDRGPEQRVGRTLAVLALPAALILAAKAFALESGALTTAAMSIVAALTVISLGAYLAGWLRHMAG